MKRQRIIVQMKEQSRNTQVQLNKRGNKENYLKIIQKKMIVQLFQLQSRMEKMQEEIETINCVMSL